MTLQIMLSADVYDVSTSGWHDVYITRLKLKQEQTVMDFSKAQ